MPGKSLVGGVCLSFSLIEGCKAKEKKKHEQLTFIHSIYYEYNFINTGFLFFSVKDRNLFHRVETISNIFMSGAATSENITDGVHEMK